MQTRERHISKPEADAVKRAGAAEAAVARHREEAASLARDLAEMREDRDRWRAQAERLAVTLERLKQPADPQCLPATEVKNFDDDTLYGVPAIAEAFRLRPRQVYHLADKHGLPTFKIGRIVCARRSSLTTWLAGREATAMGGQ